MSIFYKYTEMGLKDGDILHDNHVEHIEKGIVALDGEITEKEQVYAQNEQAIFDMGLTPGEHFRVANKFYIVVDTQPLGVEYLSLQNGLFAALEFEACEHDLFLAEYGVTTYAEIRNAYDVEGKLPVVMVPIQQGSTTTNMFVLCEDTDNNFTFACPKIAGNRFCAVSTTNQWSNNFYPFPRILNGKTANDQGVLNLTSNDIKTNQNDTLEQAFAKLQLGKQGKLTAGQNITITEDNVISATGGGSGAVQSVNGKTGTVVLSGADIDVGGSGTHSTTKINAAIEELASKHALFLVEYGVTTYAQIRQAYDVERRFPVLLLQADVPSTVDMFVMCEDSNYGFTFQCAKAAGNRLAAVSTGNVWTNNFYSFPHTLNGKVASDAGVLTLNSNDIKTNANQTLEEAFAALSLAKQDKLTAGTGISIVNNVISATGSGGGGIFVAEYDVTTYTEIINAVNAGKVVICNKTVNDSGFSRTYYLEYIDLDTLKASFVCYGNGWAFYVHCESPNTWSISMTNYTLRVNSKTPVNSNVTLTGEDIDVSSTDTTKINEELASKQDNLHTQITTEQELRTIPDGVWILDNTIVIPIGEGEFSEIYPNTIIEVAHTDGTPTCVNAPSNGCLYYIEDEQEQYWVCYPLDGWGREQHAAFMDSNNGSTFHQATANEVTQIQQTGTKIATIAGKDIYAPPGGGAQYTAGEGIAIENNVIRNTLMSMQLTEDNITLVSQTPEEADDTIEKVEDDYSGEKTEEYYEEKKEEPVEEYEEKKEATEEEYEEKIASADYYTPKKSTKGYSSQKDFISNKEKDTGTIFYTSGNSVNDQLTWESGSILFNLGEHATGTGRFQFMITFQTVEQYLASGKVGEDWWEWLESEHGDYNQMELKIVNGTFTCTFINTSTSTRHVAHTYDVTDLIVHYAGFFGECPDVEIESVSGRIVDLVYGLPYDHRLDNAFDEAGFVKIGKKKVALVDSKNANKHQLDTDDISYTYDADSDTTYYYDYYRKDYALLCAEERSYTYIPINIDENHEATTWTMGIYNCDYQEFYPLQMGTYDETAEGAEVVRSIIFSAEWDDEWGGFTCQWIMKNISEEVIYESEEWQGMAYSGSGGYGIYFSAAEKLDEPMSIFAPFTEYPQGVFFKYKATEMDESSSADIWRDFKMWWTSEDNGYTWFAEGYNINYGGSDGNHMLTNGNLLLRCGNIEHTPATWNFYIVGAETTPHIELTETSDKLITDVYYTRDVVGARITVFTSDGGHETEYVKMGRDGLVALSFSYDGGAYSTFIDFFDPNISHFRGMYEKIYDSAIANQFVYGAVKYDNDTITTNDNGQLTCSGDFNGNVTITGTSPYLEIGDTSLNEAQLQELLSSSGGTNVFLATYNVTTFAQVTAAVDAGKAVFMKDLNGIPYPLSQFNSSYATFGSFDGGTNANFEKFTLTYQDEWSSHNYNFARIVNSNSPSTNGEVWVYANNIPVSSSSSKKVDEALEEKQDKLTAGTGIKIENNVISVDPTGEDINVGGSGTHANTKLDVVIEDLYSQIQHLQQLLQEKG